LTKKATGFFDEYEVKFYAPDNIYRLGKSENAPICIVFATSAIQEKVLGQFSRRTLRKGDSVEAKMPHKERAERSNQRGIAHGKPDRM